MPKARGPANGSWRGGRKAHSNGYVSILMPEHPRADSQGYVFEHILVVERALGHELKLPHEVHHFDRNKRNNAPTNLVACEDRAYHMLLHRRMRALLECGDPNALKCVRCKKYDRQEDITDCGCNSYHRSCAREHMRERQRKPSDLRVA